MNNNFSFYIKLYVWSSAVFTLIRCILSLSTLLSLCYSYELLLLLYNLFGYIGEAIGLATIFMIIFNKWIWKLKCFTLLHHVPILSKKYKGTIVSDFDNSKHEGILEINQTFLKQSIKFITDESLSRSISSSISEIHDTCMLIYVYQNEPKGELQDVSPIHYGTAMLDLSNPSEISGNYYTGRNTKGSMHFKSVSS